MKNKSDKILDIVKQNKQTVDDFTAYVDNIITLNGYTMGEIAAALTYLMEKQLHKDKAEAFLKQLGVHEETYTPEQVVAIQRLLTEQYIRELSDKHDT